MKATITARQDAPDHVVQVEWAADGSRITAVPATGAIFIWDGESDPLELPDHGLGNGWAAWHPSDNRLATAGYDGRVRIYEDLPRTAEPKVERSLGRGWIERVRWSPDGNWLAAAIGKRLLILDPAGEIRHEYAGHRSTVCDFVWNPQQPDEIAAVCDGGAYMWRLGEPEAFARFDWGGASLIATWSPDGRWVVTGDQTPSVHLYDFTRDEPLHIQGYETKVKALAFNSASRRLASGGGRLVTVWACTGKRGPEGSVPKQLEGHDGDCVALAYRGSSDLLASGGTDGYLFFYEPETSVRPRAVARFDDGVTSVAWHPKSPLLVAGTATGEIALVTVG